MGFRSTITFRELHQGDLPLVLPNAWDVPSALARRGSGIAGINIEDSIAGALISPDAHAAKIRAAGGIFVPGVAPEVIAEPAAHIERPVNVLAIPERSLADLTHLGVRRVSTGSLPYRAAMHAAAAAPVTGEHCNEPSARNVVNTMR